MSDFKKYFVSRDRDSNQYVGSIRALLERQIRKGEVGTALRHPLCKFCYSNEKSDEVYPNYMKTKIKHFAWIHRIFRVHFRNGLAES